MLDGNFTLTKLNILAENIKKKHHFNFCFLFCPALASCKCYDRKKIHEIYDFMNGTSCVAGYIHACMIHDNPTAITSL